MKLTFYKYQATGNDFVLIDNRTSVFEPNNVAWVKQLCDRRFGIGADGLMLLDKSELADFDLVYFNSDGSKSLCGNGSRCAVKLAAQLGLFKGDSCSFNAFDGLHRAKLLANGWFSLEMHSVEHMELIEESFYLNTGSPHYISYFDEVDSMDIVEWGRSIRYNDRFKALGTNVNAVEKLANGKLKMRTYERGVENETLSCGTGATAVALSYGHLEQTNGPIHIEVKGGNLSIDFERFEQGFKNIWLNGPAIQVFKGEIEINTNEI